MSFFFLKEGLDITKPFKFVSSVKAPVINSRGIKTRKKNHICTTHSTENIRHRIIRPILCENRQTKKYTTTKQNYVPVGRIPCRDSCGGHSSPSVVCSPVSALPSDDSAAVSCTPPVGLSFHLPACCVPDAAWQSGFEAGWWQTCHRLHGGAVAT